ncbi:MFS transporter [Pacificibacter maritimus]|uniref:MFS transporter n=1 Tax=Pacificibacter maritimus TaxID=762213 RepID=A0A3N4TZ95_9RHOB|nr:MFS transporter [Pacificibacter maritimus]RPE63128.1 MFS transporter [Pacificibacter maritimus]
MIKGLFWLIAAYSLSQFYRACLAVFAPVLQLEIDLSPDQISTALGIWFVMFSAMQIPVGWLLDNKSPRKTAATFLALGGGLGALVFSSAQGAWAIYVAMALIGIGCAPVLMTSFYIFARLAPSNRFGTLAGIVVGIGSIGNVAASAPLSFAMTLIGWRAVCIALAVGTLLIAYALLKFVADPPKVDRPKSSTGNGFSALVRIWPLYPICVMAAVAYAPSAGLRGSWAGAYLSDIYGLGSDAIGQVTFFMALSMILGALVFGPLDRLIESRKTIVLGATGISLGFIAVLWAGVGSQSIVMITVLLIGIGFFGSAYSQIMNHGRSVLPAHLTGRGVTLINLFSIGGAGVGQFATAQVFAVAPQSPAATPYGAVFATYSILLLLGGLVYAFSRNKVA